MFGTDKSENAEIQRPPSAKSFAVRWGEGVARHRREVIVCWFVLLIVSGTYAPSLQGRLTAPDLSADHSESAQAKDLINQHFSYRGNEQDVLVFESLCSNGGGGPRRSASPAPGSCRYTFQSRAVFCLVFGLSMDYDVCLIRRIKECCDTTGNNEDTVAVGIEHTARPITAAAAIMVAIFSSFVGADILEPSTRASDIRPT
jgi:uncharacterized membrane protein YdfJ with MMPL/SSD domain